MQRETIIGNDDRFSQFFLQFIDPTCVVCGKLSAGKHWYSSELIETLRRHIGLINGDRAADWLTDSYWVHWIFCQCISQYVQKTWISPPSESVITLVSLITSTSAVMMMMMMRKLNDWLVEDSHGEHDLALGERWLIDTLPTMLELASVFARAAAEVSAHDVIFVVLVMVILVFVGKRHDQQTGQEKHA